MWCRVLGNNLIGPHIKVMFNGSILKKFSVKWISFVFRGWSSCNVTNVATTWLGTCTCQLRGNGNFQHTIWRNIDWNMWTSGLGCLVSQLPNLNPLDFLMWSCLKARVYHGGKTEGRHQSLQPKMKSPLVSETNWDTCSDNIQRHKD